MYYFKFIAIEVSFFNGRYKFAGLAKVFKKVMKVQKEWVVLEARGTLANILKLKKGSTNAVNFRPHYFQGHEEPADYYRISSLIESQYLCDL